MTDRTPGGRRSTRRILTLALGGALIAAAMSVAPAAATPSTAPGVALPAPAIVHVDTATMTGWDVYGKEYGFGTVRLNTYWNAQQTAWSKQTLRFSMHDLGKSMLYYARIGQGTCAEGPESSIKIAVRTNAAGRLTKTVTLTSVQQAIMARFAGEYPAVSITLSDAGGSTGVSIPRGQIWGEGW